MNSVNIKDFIIDLETAKKKSSEKTPMQNKTSKPTIEYSVVLSNNIDIVINKKTKTTDKDLVFLVSKELFYIKDNKSETVQDITCNNTSEIKRFMKDVNYDFVSFVEGVMWWNRESCIQNTSIMINVIEDSRLRKLYKHGFVDFSQYGMYSMYNAIEQNPKILKYCIEKNATANILDVALFIAKEINYNNAIEFIDKTTSSNVECNIYEHYSNNGSYFVKISEEYKLNWKRYLNYLFDDLYAQGIQRLDRNILDIYKDYLHMQISLFGYIKEKYPKALKTDHDKIALKLTIYKNYSATDDTAINNISIFHKHLGYKKYDYIITLPEKASDIVDEGINLNHCVATYVEKVVNGKSLILFLRNADSPNDSLITVEVLDGHITQAKGFNNRNVNLNEGLFLKKWAKARKLELDIHYIMEMEEVQDGEENN